MRNPRAAEVLPVDEEPAFVSYLTWRASKSIVAADLDQLVAGLMEADAEVCIQTPADLKASFVVSLGCTATGYYEAAVESASLLLAAATALGIDAYLVHADVCSGDGQEHFDRIEMVRGLRT